MPHYRGRGTARRADGTGRRPRSPGSRTGVGSRKHDPDHTTEDEYTTTKSDAEWIKTLETPGTRGRILVDALLARVKRGDIELQSAINRFEVRVSETGEAWIERLRW